MIESFNCRLRNECLNVHLFWTAEDPRGSSRLGDAGYKAVRPHSSLGHLKPKEYAARSRSKADAPEGTGIS